MALRVLFFASLADITGTSEVELEASPNVTIGAVFATLAARFPLLEPHRKSILFARNSRYATPDTPVQDGDEIAFLPPVSGG
ncbi:MAG: molybdopterin converting factor subunit 1 [Acidobacteria bacterium]|nr:molybdopterin converting factor subunit 1 [Acidobacteriota bacterium]